MVPCHWHPYGSPLRVWLNGSPTMRGGTDHGKAGAREFPSGAIGQPCGDIVSPVTQSPFRPAHMYGTG